MASESEEFPQIDEIPQFAVEISLEFLRLQEPHTHTNTHENCNINIKFLILCRLFMLTGIASCTYNICDHCLMQNL